MAKRPTKGDDGTGARGGSYPEGYDVSSNKERQHQWNSRLLGVLLMASMILNLTLGFALAALSPLKEVRPFLVQMTEAKDVFANIRPIQEDPDAPRSGLPFLTKELVANYVKYRHEIVRSEDIMKLRWVRPGYVSLMSSEEEYGKFLNSVSEIYKEMRKKDVTLEVSITAVNETVPLRSYQVNFDTLGRSNANEIVSKSSWIATMDVEYKQLVKVNHQDVRLNPTGFTVTNYTISEKR
jgi:type IV secretory pathway component VirB8